MPQLHVTTLDLAIVVGYVVVTRVVFGWWAARRAAGEGSEGYFLAGRRMAWPLIGLSFYVSNMSGSTFVGLPGSGYANGIAVFNYEWLPSLILVFFAVFLLPAYLRVGVYTAPQFLEGRYDRRSRMAFSGFLLVANVMIDAAAALYAGGAVVRTLLPGVPLWVTVAVASLAAGAYIFAGGLGAVVLNDSVQALLILAGGTTISVLAFRKIPSWDAVRAATAPGALHLIQPASDPVMPGLGIITGVLVIGIYFWCTNQFVIQRALAARTLEHGRLGGLFAALLKLPNLFILVIPGVIGAVLYPNLAHPDLVFPTLAFDLLPIGLRGFMLAALAAAILSSLESILNSAATLFTMDFFHTLRPRTRDAVLVRVGRWSTLGFMVLSALWAPQIDRFPTLWQYLQSILAYVTPPVVAVFVLGLFWKRAAARGAFLALAVGIPLGAAGWVVVEILHVWSVQFLYACGVMLVVGVVLVVVGSLTAPPPSAERVRPYLWRRSDARAERPYPGLRGWLWDYRLWSAVLLGACVVLVAWWW